MSSLACGSSAVQAGGVGEGDGDPEAGQLVQDQHLVGVGAGEPVRGQAPDHLEQPGLGGVAQRVQPGPVQPGPGMPVVAVLAGQLVAGGGQVRAQRSSWEPIVPRSAWRSVDTRA